MKWGSTWAIQVLNWPCSTSFSAWSHVSFSSPNPTFVRYPRFEFADEGPDAVGLEPLLVSGGGETTA